MKSFPTYTFIFLMTALSLTAACRPERMQLEQQVVSALKNTWCSEDKAKLILECVITNRPEVCVEVGAFTGSSTLPILAGLQYLKHGRAYVIDAWSNDAATYGLPKEDPNAMWWASLNMRSIKNQFVQMISNWSFTPYCEVLHMSSQQAASRLPPIQFIHLDGNFSEEGALLDTQLYLPKVVSGGHILISNVLVMVGNKPTKMKALWPLFEQCNIVGEIDNGNTLLFKKI